MTRQSYEELLTQKDENKVEDKDIQGRETSSILQQGTSKLTFLQKQQVRDDHQLSNIEVKNHNISSTNNNNGNWRTVSFKKRPNKKEQEMVVTM